MRNTVGYSEQMRAAHVDMLALGWKDGKIRMELKERFGDVPTMRTLRTWKKELNDTMALTPDVRRQKLSARFLRRTEEQLKYDDDMVKKYRGVIVTTEELKSMATSKFLESQRKREKDAFDRSIGVERFFTKGEPQSTNTYHVLIQQLSQLPKEAENDSSSDTGDRGPEVVDAEFNEVAGTQGS